MFSISLVLSPVVQPMTALESVKSPLTTIAEQPLELDKTSTSSVRAYIEAEAVKHEFDPELASAIARAESDYIHHAKNPIPSASGVYQFLDSTFKNYCIEMYELTDTMKDKDDVKIQTECALLIMTTDKKGINHWLASRHVWNKYAPPKGG